MTCKLHVMQTHTPRRHCLRCTPKDARCVSISSRCAHRATPSARSVYAALSKLVFEYERRSEVIAKLVASADATTEAAKRRDTDYRAALRERDAAVAEARRLEKLSAQAQHSGKVCGLSRTA